MTDFSVQRLFERLMVAASALTLLGAAAVLDDRVRDRASGVFAGTAMSELSLARDYAARALQQATNTVGYQSSEHGTLVFFVVAASILFLVMLRT
jgi:hypothetical protein